MTDFGGVTLHGGRFRIVLDTAGDMFLLTPSGKRLRLTEEDAGMLATDWNREGPAPRASSVWVKGCKGCGSMSLYLDDRAGNLLASATMPYQGAVAFADGFCGELEAIGVPDGSCGDAPVPTAPSTETRQ